MRIKEAEVHLLDLPADEPLANVPANPAGTRPHVLLQLRTDDGIEGIGFTFLGAGLSCALKTAVEEMAELCDGLDPLDRISVHAHIEAKAGGTGPGGMFNLALAAIDIALWDIAAKACGQPLWRMLGARAVRVPTYASGALMRELDLDTALRACERLRASGFRQAKMQLALPGDFDPQAEMQRARLVREALGDDMMLMCDINQRWSAKQALRMGRMLEEIGFAWLEDPAGHDDLRGLNLLASRLSTPVAAGEYLYGPGPFRQLLEAGGVDVVMIDPFRAGGITGWLSIAALAQAHGRPVVSHLAPEIQVHLIAAIPNGMTVEYMPWSHAMFENVPWPANGHLELPTAPGLGLQIDRRAIERYKRQPR